jgi:membrane fusion protein (multidrug efflux system)
MKINRSSRLLVIIFPALLAFSCGNSGAKKSDEQNEITYEVSVVKSKNVTNQIVLPGELQGYYETGILAKVNGYVKRVLVDIGDKVSKDQLLAELEAPELMSELIGAYSESKSKEAVYLNTKAKLIRLSQTNQTKGAVSPYDMDLSKTSVISDSLAYLAAKAKYESVKSLVDYLKITAPFNGIITERHAAPGAFVGPDDRNLMPLFILKSEDKLRLHIAVPEKHIAEVMNGGSIEFTVESFPNRKFSGKITRFEKSLKPQTRSEVVEIEIDNKSDQLLPGMFAKVVLPTQRGYSSIVVPESAVVINMERSFLIKIENQNKAVWVDVKKGELQGNNVEVFGKINRGDTILNVASDEIKDGSTIRTILVNKNEQLK